MTNPIVTSQWLKDNFNNPNLIILDASQDSNKAGLVSDVTSIQIKNARSINLKAFSDSNSRFPNTFPSIQQFETECQKLGINNSSIIVVYDNLGIYTSPRVWWMFKTMGHQHIAVLDGGLPDWANNGFETETITKKDYKTGAFKATLNPEMIKDFKFIKDNTITQNSLLIDARSSGRFKGLAPEPRKELKSGHIPNSINIPFEDVLDNGKLKSKNELNSIFKSLKTENRPLVFSCGSGITACIVLLASEQILNNKTSVYDGSWTEWATLEPQ